MRIVVDYSKCVSCGECLKACPVLEEEKSMQIFNCDNCNKCVNYCPEKAILIKDGITSIDKSKCTNCGNCALSCEKDAVVLQKRTASKCNLCYDFEKPKCIEACAYNAISIELDDEEKVIKNESIGWEKIEVPDESIEIILSEKNHDIIQFRNEKIYILNVKEPSIDEIRIAEKVIEKIRKTSEINENISEQLLELYLFKNKIKATAEQEKNLVKLIKSEISGYCILDELLENDNLEEITIISTEKPVYVYHRKHGWMKTNLRIYSEKKIRDLMNRMGRNIGRRITFQNPRMNANIPLGRLHATMPPLSAKTPTMTIRKFKTESFTADELIKNETISAEAMAFLKMAIQCDLNILVCGNTGSGKTSTLNVLLNEIPKNERIIIIEETPEIEIKHEHIVKMNVTEKITMHELVEDTLRMRPDRVIVGEVRTEKEVKALINTMLAGQGKSSFATFHAQDSEEALMRLINLGINKSDLKSLDLIIVQRRWTDLKEKKDVRKIIEISCVNKKTGKIENIFDYNYLKRKLYIKNILENSASEKIKICFGIDNQTLENEIILRKNELRC